MIEDEGVKRSSFLVKIDFKPGEVTCILDEVRESKSLILLTHGAGAGIHHTFMEQLSLALTQFNHSVWRFNLPYMERGGRPTKAQEAQGCIQQIIDEAASRGYDQIFLAGKSYGGRMSSHVLAQNPSAPVKGLIFYGFPLHAPGKAGDQRGQHLIDIQQPMLFLQGTRDSLANLTFLTPLVDEIETASIAILEDGDHSFKTPKRSGRSHSQNIHWLAEQTDLFVRHCQGKL